MKEEHERAAKAEEEKRAERYKANQKYQQQLESQLEASGHSETKRVSVVAFGLFEVLMYNLALWSIYSTCICICICVPPPNKKKNPIILQLSMHARFQLFCGKKRYAK